MILAALIAAAVFALCAVLRKRLTGAAPRPLWGGRAALEPMYNCGAAFGLKLTGRPLCALTTGALALLVWTVAQPVGPAARVGGGLALGGGAANLYERLRHKRVLDYLRFPHLPGRGKALVFNAADFAIFAGLLLLLLGGGRRGK